MRFYFINHDGVPYSHYATLSEAKKAAKEAAKLSYDEVNVELVDVLTTKDNILRLLNTDSGTQVSIETVFTAKAGKG